MAFDWSKMTDEEALEAVRTQPVVYGPWTQFLSFATFFRQSAKSGMAWVRRDDDAGHWTSSRLGDESFANAELVMEAVDKKLREQGARLVGPSKVEVK
jgi:hypothetical protein